MALLKRRMIFISHAWRYDDHYRTIERWLNEEPNFIWSNSSVPNTNALPDKTSAGLSRGMTRQITPSQVVLIIAGMYANHSAWIEYEIKEAQRLGKKIIGIRPRGHERTPRIVQDASICPLVSWSRSSVIRAIRTYA